MRSADSATQPMKIFKKRYTFRTTISQKRMELGVGCSIIFRSRSTLPKSTRMNIKHIVTAATARNSPRIVTFANGL